MNKNLHIVEEPITEKEFHLLVKSKGFVEVSDTDLIPVLSKSMTSGIPMVVQDLESHVVMQPDGSKKIKHLYPMEKGKNKHDFSSEERKRLANEGAAQPDGSYPIRNSQDLKDAIKAVGRSKNIEKTIAHIKKRAKELNLINLLPDGWK